MIYPILYSFRRCPYAMRARMALIYSQQIVEVREIKLKNKPSSMLSYSPKGTVPVLVLNPESSSRNVIDESLSIMLWAMKNNDKDHWLLSSLSQQYEATKLIARCDNVFKKNLDRYKYADRYPEYDTEYYRQQGEVFLNELNLRLTHHTYLCGKKLSLADIAIFPFIRQFAHVDKLWFEQTKYTQLIKWLNEHLESDLFISAMLKYPVWEESDNSKVITYLK